MKIESSRSPVVGGGRRRGAADKEKVRRSRTLGAREGIANNFLYFFYLLSFFLACFHSLFCLFPSFPYFMDWAIIIYYQLKI
jgi:hypothetical protein